MLRKHAFWMIVCCALPVAALALLPLLGIQLKGGLGSLALVLLCPLSHLILMRGMHGAAHRGGDRAGAGREEACHREAPGASAPGPARPPRGRAVRLPD